ncbi:hypothetical protein ABVK25_005527 [Lepraria finkii]|uniref:Uncharacterized protein n=1 Tax=Lepraria finkii TaxID=1340010 RepID=A0ABR4B946_9LECA
MFIAFQCWTEQRDTYACWAGLVSSVDESTRLRIVDLERQKMERTTNKAYINVRKDNQVVMRAIVGNSIRLPGASCVPKTKTQPRKDDPGSRPQYLPPGEQKPSEWQR